LTVREFIQLQKELREDLYLTIPLKTLFERNPQISISALPKSLHENKLTVPRMEGWELNWNLMPLALSKNNACIVIAAKPSRPDITALSHLPGAEKPILRLSHPIVATVPHPIA
jgi:hypothetical protein